MSEENPKKIRKFYQKKRYIIPTGFLLFLTALGIWAQKDIGNLIDECNKGSIEKCKELEDDYPSSYDEKAERAKITNPYFKDKFQKLDEIQDAAEIKKAEEIKALEIEAAKKKKALEIEAAEKRRIFEETKKKNAEEAKRRDESVLKMKLCKELLKKNLKDPNSYKELNTLLEQFQTGIIRYTATNSFGGRIQETFNCNNYELK